MVKVITFGCRLNFYESDLIENLVGIRDRRDFIIINTCAVTNEAVRKVKQKIRKCHKEEPEKKIIVVGCGPQLDPNVYSHMPGVFKVLGNVEKLKAESYASEQKIAVADITNASETAFSGTIMPVVSTVRKRAFLEIQNGCDHDCTFCAITLARGKNRSSDAMKIVLEVRKMVAAGINEVVLTGVDITDYGKDFFGKPALVYLLKEILSGVPELKRLRLSSVDVSELGDDFVDLFATEARLMPHLHLSIQSGDPIILKRMKRRHTPEQVVEFHSKILAVRPETGFGADIIVGFPTETEEMFRNSYELIKKLAIPYLHVFPFSPKNGTKAALMPQVDGVVKKGRAKQLIELGKENLRIFNAAQLGSIHNLVLERDDIGRSENFCLVKLDSAVSNDAGIIRTKIMGCSDAEMLSGQVIV
ncbi:tRNA (N(6)-L-threonylcarbamoyladenosine(37)-C(2))-methylthiotransferase MtaB [Neorickettsia sp. 179522]|uniref:tRNA (N(6)-L-threonylcarbamoyladenosine(37)-C(2))- methylthiotransferase MtaB n=1 Tax=Neorickettsia sp. 179522 TaxID=1714371 RepID=UPI000794E1EF|nr:tRNA (N(6)-L-threonylcarbamoyladenosine(37)-C(2))-methylthiotransferase MtaB [Neorickettsia sp. 179522]KYH12748.1 tRNA (N(6)-L-threonylcarbamoyladenosine(37)-C(2))-methylthiotransferase MtaB [Neorickettsia sp. 179522]